MNTTFYIIFLLVSIVLCVMIGTYFSHKANQYEYGGEPPDILKIDDIDKRKQSKSNREPLRKIAVAFTFKVTFK